jgi:hypothetical protein
MKNISRDKDQSCNLRTVGVERILRDFFFPSDCAIFMMKEEASERGCGFSKSTE